MTSEERKNIGAGLWLGSSLVVVMLVMMLRAVELWSCGELWSGARMFTFRCNKETVIACPAARLAPPPPGWGQDRSAELAVVQCGLWCLM